MLEEAELERLQREQDTKLGNAKEQRVNSIMQAQYSDSSDVSTSKLEQEMVVVEKIST
jgi:hypothetical protein